MEESYDPAFIVSHFSGAATHSFFIVKLMMQVLGVLIVGMILWRIGSAFGSKKKARKNNMFTQSTYNSWKRR